ncbi:hypothetical protein NMY22_g15937 [Coprinellus aureogranulatus]|nr:hypothetical protein NMY22_g15937 [Coprinellus aureogranulatus]
MDRLRRRIPFRLQEGDESVEAERVLDEQEQEEVIESLRTANEASTAQNYQLIQALLGLSLAAQLTYLFTPSKRTLLANVFPIPASADSTPIPLSTLLTLVYILLHVNLLVVCRLPLLANLPQQLSPNLHAITPLSFGLTYAVSAVGPALALFLGKPWQTTAWWFLTTFIAYVAQTVVEAIEEGRNGVAEVEGMRYVAPGA